MKNKIEIERSKYMTEPIKKPAASDLSAAPCSRQMKFALEQIMNITAQDGCTCVDPPQDREKDDERGCDPEDPSAHAQYCPSYLTEVARCALSDDPHPA